MAQEENRRYSPRYMTPDEVIAYYKDNDQPLDGEVIVTALEPLAGTSFLPLAQKALRETIQKKRMFLTEDTHLTTRDLYLSLYGAEPYEAMQDVESRALQDEALAAFHTFTTYPVEVQGFMKYRPLQPDELFVLQERFDHVFSDETQTTDVFTHIADQWRFYKGGSLLHVIETSRVVYDYRKEGKFPVHYRLSEGYHAVSFFDDPKRLALPFVDPKLQAYHRSVRFLGISPTFTYEAARRK